VFFAFFFGSGDWSQVHTLARQVPQPGFTSEGNTISYSSHHKATKTWKQPVSADAWMDKKCVTHTLLCYKKKREKNPAICNDINETWEHYSKWNNTYCIISQVESKIVAWCWWMENAGGHLEIFSYKMNIHDDHS
jgi:hypothetical protein